MLPAQRASFLPRKAASQEAPALVQWWSLRQGPGVVGMAQGARGGAEPLFPTESTAGSL
jgi:hypothetical protein